MKYNGNLAKNFCCRGRDHILILLPTPSYSEINESSLMWMKIQDLTFVFVL